MIYSDHNLMLLIISSRLEIASSLAAYRNQHLIEIHCYNCTPYIFCDDCAIKNLFF